MFVLVWLYLSRGGFCDVCIFLVVCVCLGLSELCLCSFYFFVQLIFPFPIEPRRFLALLIVTLAVTIVCFICVECLIRCNGLARGHLFNKYRNSVYSAVVSGFSNGCKVPPIVI